MWLTNSGDFKNQTLVKLNIIKIRPQTTSTQFGVNSSKWLIALTISLFFVSMTKAQGTLDRKKIRDEISMKIPSEFLAMIESERNRKYVSAREPLALYTNRDRTVDLGINETSSIWGSGDLEILKDFYKSNILNLYNEVFFIQDEIITIGERSFIALEFNSKVTDDSGLSSRPIAKYTYILYTLRNERVLLFNFSAPLRYRQTWQPVAREMMESIRIK